MCVCMCVEVVVAFRKIRCIFWIRNAHRQRQIVRFRCMTLNCSIYSSTLFVHTAHGWMVMHANANQQPSTNLQTFIQIRGFDTLRFDYFAIYSFRNQLTDEHFFCFFCVSFGRGEILLHKNKAK